eukprot:5665129-Pleurochrysis_carterae.AAC.1
MRASRNECKEGLERKWREDVARDRPKDRVHKIWLATIENSTIGDMRSSARTKDQRGGSIAASASRRARSGAHGAD